MLALIPLLMLAFFSIAVKDRLKTDTMVVYFAALMLSVDVLYFAALADFLRPAAMVVFAVLGGVSTAGVFSVSKKGKTPLAADFTILREIVCKWRNTPLSWND